MAPILCIAAVEMEAEATLQHSRNTVREVAVILFIVTVEETEATLEVSRHIIRGMALIFCIVAGDMEAKGTL